MDLDFINDEPICIGECKSCIHYKNCMDSDFFYEYHNEYNDPYTSIEDWERTKAYIDDD